jgi:hypothetical protein
MIGRGRRTKNACEVSVKMKVDSSLNLSQQLFRDDDAALPQPAGRKVTYTGSFPLTLARRALRIGSSISLSGNPHPQSTREIPPFTSGDQTSHFRESGGQASYLSISENPKTVNADPFLPYFRFLLIAISAVAMSSNPFPRFPKPDLPKLRCARKL